MIFGSVCAGIEAASVAWLPLGWRCAFVAEIEPFCCAVLRHHYPDVRNYGDFTRITAEAGPIDVLVGGTPCQSFSIAGKRAGLDDPRGVLAFEFLALAGRLCPRWVVWENVPGVRSSGKGRDFGAFLGALGELGYGWAYRSLDAQYDGLAQRRERVFVVGCLGNWRGATAVLFDAESLSGNPPPRREAGERVAGTVAASAGKRRGGGQLEGMPLIAAGLTGRYGKGTDSDATDALVFQCQGTNVGEMGCLRSGNGNVTGGVPFVVHTLTVDGFDASEDGTGRGVPLVPVAFDDPRRFDARGIHRGGAHGTLHPPVTVRIPSALIAFQADASSRQSLNPGSISPTVDAGKKVAIQETTGVRRLMPTEVEALFGFPRDYTLVPYRGKPAADSNRYKSLGNSMAVPVMRWIGERIQMVDALLEAR